MSAHPARSSNPSPPPGDPFYLQRFVEAQQPVYGRVLAELQAGQKTSHWMWFVFPQMAGLGRTSTAQHYGIKSHAEAVAYLADPVLGERLVVCTETVLGHDGLSTAQIFGSPDDLKFHSCMTLFAEVAGPDSVFARALQRLCGGLPDARTLALLR